MKVVPVVIAIIYLAVIIVFAEIYLAWGDCDFSQDIETRTDSYYFSVVTITTLGYGDVSPVSPEAKRLTAIQALLGIFIIGIFLTYLAQAFVHVNETKIKDAKKRNFLKQYAFFKAQMVALCVDAAIMCRRRDGKSSYDDSQDVLLERFKDPTKFREFYSPNSWYDVQNGMSDNAGIVSDMHMELEMLIVEIRALLSTVTTNNETAIYWLTGFYKDAQRVVHGRHTADDPGEYFANYIFGILANQHVVDWSAVDDRVLVEVNAL